MIQPASCPETLDTRCCVERSNVRPSTKSPHAASKSAANFRRAHQHSLHPALSNKSHCHTLLLHFKLLKYFPALRRIPARMIDLGFRPEYVHTPDVKSQF